VLYITASSPFIPTCKRIRSLLTAIGKREAQSAAEGSKRGKRGKALEANGRLEAKDVEASIASGANLKGKKSKDIGSEEVYLKATGRAIPRALELGVKFQGEDDCRVRVEMGSVKAIDDLEVKSGSESAQAEGEEPREEEEVPETRIRTLSTVTVCIGLK
jgi:ribonuclease P/MRP protein subunit POP7